MTEKIKPEQRFTMGRDSFFGEYYRAKDNAFPDKCMIAFGGSVGKFLLSQMMAWEFAAAGMDVLILAYHGEPRLPKRYAGQKRTKKRKQYAADVRSSEFRYRNMHPKLI